jgi:hypothetical protein
MGSSSDSLTRTLVAHVHCDVQGAWARAVGGGWGRSRAWEVRVVLSLPPQDWIVDEAEAAAMAVRYQADGYFATGDIGTIINGRLHIIDRASSVVKVTHHFVPAVPK